MTFRSRKLLDKAHIAPCFLRLSPTCGNHPSVPCHSDMLRHGRGVGHKSGDHYAVAACPDCHALFTRGNLARGGYEETWRQAHHEYLCWLIENGHLRAS